MLKSILYRFAVFSVPNIKANKVSRSVVTGGLGWSAPTHPVFENPNYSYNTNQIRTAKKPTRKRTPKSHTDSVFDVLYIDEKLK